MSTLPTPLVDAAWLIDHLNDEDLVVVCALSSRSGRIPDAGIPGTRIANIEAEFSEPHAELPHTAPTNLQAPFEQLGISSDTKVVIYDNPKGFFAARIWWLGLAAGLDQVAVLDGGLVAWEKAGGELAPFNLSAPLAGKIQSKLRPLFVDADGLGLVVDARSAERFAGTAPEPRPGLRAGHIPGSVNLPYTEVLNDDGTFRSPVELQELFADFGSDNMHFSCGSGVTACIDALAATLAGYKNLKVYDGSWSEWGRPNSGFEVAEGDAG
ncbi:sulfurtransferase [Corynebacterium epidermidicanis]|uniref:Rhodanese-related sulfurtransferase n=1 Tax=Corynebacterium epidermidicanis TaxID=1050174 RepID=A0A0G3GU15_9CORY|nr:sulfurtransferase [Corynebacterium epidermidicanis]AKK03058.1 rhodanese-related sulfurtransferase [Corynebacterium epidermidicanis]